MGPTRPKTNTLGPLCFFEKEGSDLAFPDIEVMIITNVLLSSI